MTVERSAVLVQPRQMELREFPIPAVADDTFLLKVNLVTICGGDPIEYEGRNVKAHYPMILGHEMVRHDRADRRRGGAALWRDGRRPR